MRNGKLSQHYLQRSLSIYARSETIIELEHVHAIEQDFVVPVFDFVQSVVRSVTVAGKRGILETGEP